MIEAIERINSVVNNFIWGVPAMLCIFGVGLYLYCRWDETSHRFGLADASALRSSPIRGAKSRGKIAARRSQRYGKINRSHARMEEPDYWTNQKDA